jgi:hypothetical protein
MGVMGIILGTFERKNEMGGENEEHMGTCGNLWGTQTQCSLLKYNT